MGITVVRFIGCWHHHYYYYFGGRVAGFGRNAVRFCRGPVCGDGDRAGPSKSLSSAVKTVLLSVLFYSCAK